MQRMLAERQVDRSGGGVMGAYTSILWTAEPVGNGYRGIAKEGECVIAECPHIKHTTRQGALRCGDLQRRVDAYLQSTDQEARS